MDSRLLARSAAAAAIAAIVPLLFVGNGLYLLTHGWFVRAEYARPGFPDDAFGMGRAERTRLAKAGLYSILPWHGDGLERLRDARLDDGARAFDARERRHMRDVRRLLTILLALHAVALVTVAALVSMRRTRDLARWMLRAGGFVTLGLFVLVAFLLLADDDWFLTGFHTVFFEGSTWRFADQETLRRLFPDLFWRDTATILGVAALLQAALGLWWSWWRPRRRVAEEARIRP